MDHLYDESFVTCIKIQFHTFKVFLGMKKTSCALATLLQLTLLYIITFSICTGAHGLKNVIPNT